MLWKVTCMWMILWKNPCKVIVLHCPIQTVSTRFSCTDLHWVSLQHDNVLDHCFEFLSKRVRDVWKYLHITRDFLSRQHNVWIKMIHPTHNMNHFYSHIMLLRQGMTSYVQIFSDIPNFLAICTPLISSLCIPTTSPFSAFVNAVIFIFLNWLCHSTYVQHQTNYFSHKIGLQKWGIDLHLWK